MKSLQSWTHISLAMALALVSFPGLLSSSAATHDLAGSIERILTDVVEEIGLVRDISVGPDGAYYVGSSGAGVANRIYRIDPVTFNVHPWMDVPFESDWRGDFDIAEDWTVWLHNSLCLYRMDGASARLIFCHGSGSDGAGGIDVGPDGAVYFPGESPGCNLLEGSDAVMRWSAIDGFSIIHGSCGDNLSIDDVTFDLAGVLHFTDRNNAIVYKLSGGMRTSVYAAPNQNEATNLAFVDGRLIYVNKIQSGGTWGKIFYSDEPLSFLRRTSVSASAGVTEGGRDPHWVIEVEVANVDPATLKATDSRTGTPLGVEWSGLGPIRVYGATVPAWPWRIILNIETDDGRATGDYAVLV